MTKRLNIRELDATGSPDGTKALFGDGSWKVPADQGAVLYDAKGDILIGSANDARSRLAVGTDGQVLTADSAQPLGVKWATPTAGGGGGAPAPLWALKPVNESVTSSTVLQDDDHLVLSLAASSTYRFEAVLHVYGSTAADMKISFPRAAAGWKCYWAPIAPGTNTTASDANAAFYSAFSGTVDNTLVIGTATLSNTMSVHIIGSVITDATPGNLKLQWAQSVSSTTASVIYAGSHLMAQKVV